MNKLASFQQARDLAEARKAFQAAHADPDRAIWRRRFADYQTAFGRPVVLTLTGRLELRVTCGKSGDLIVSGPACLAGGGTC